MKFSLAIGLLGLLALTYPCNAQSLMRAVNGPAANALFGKACIRIPDQNADGFDDVLVGAPGFNSQRGAIHCISGAYLASGAGAQTLWSLAPTANQGDLFGFALLAVADATGDGVTDFLVGQPGYDTATNLDTGAVRLVDGSSHVIVSLIRDTTTGAAFGTSLAAMADVNGDGRKDFLVSSPGTLTATGFARIWGLSAILLNQSFPLGTPNAIFVINGNANDGFATSFAGGTDLDGDGKFDVLVGAPTADTVNGVDSGVVTLYHCAPNGVVTTGITYTGVVGEHFGAALAAAHDYDGDGVIDFVVGGPNFPGANNAQVGRGLVLSGKRLATQAPPYEVYSLSMFGPGVTPGSIHFGTAVCASGDLNGDSVGEILVGAPDVGSLLPFAPARGNVSIFSGATGARMGGAAGANNDHLGDAIVGALQDLDGDGFDELVAAGSLSDAGGADSGVVKCFRFFPCAPATYCTGKINSLGCTPAIAFSGTASANPSAPLNITASNLVNQKTGLLFYSHAPVAVAFQGGTKCVASPFVRTQPQNSGGSTSGDDCTGTYSFDFNDWIVNGWDFTLAPGSEIYAQYWSRDPASASHTSLSNALQFVINP